MLMSKSGIGLLTLIFDPPIFPSIPGIFPLILGLLISIFGIFPFTFGLLILPVKLYPGTFILGPFISILLVDNFPSIIPDIL